MTTIINIYGGPGAGKSTLAEGVSHQLKMNGMGCELVREVVKEACWRGEKVNRPWDEFYLFGAQIRLEGALYGKVDYIVTDRPIGMSLAYTMNDSLLCSTMEEMLTTVEALRERQDVRTVDVHVRRGNKPFQKEGRFHDEARSREIDRWCKNKFPGPVVSNVGDVIAALKLG